MQNIVSMLKNKLGAVLAGSKQRRHSLVGPARLWKMKRDFQIQFLKQEGLKPSHYLLDIGCGTLRGGIPIIDYLDIGHYYGIEVRQEVLDEGYKELKEAQLESKSPVLIMSENISTLSIEQNFDFIWAFSVLIHMDDDILNSCLKFVSNQLKPTGCFYANVNADNEPTGKWQGFPVVHHSLEFYQEVGSRYGLQISSLGMIKDLGHNSGVKHQDEQIMLKCRKA